ncbi:MAG: hypothetical protein WDO13_21125 [Verrucomicrobiota bacterium]
MADFLRVPVHAACISDVAGRRHLLVLIVSLPLTIPGPPPTFVGYLFDGEGRLEDSGIFAGGAALNVPTVQPATDGRALLVGLTIHETLGFGCTVGHDGGRPTLDEWGEWNWGRPSIGYDSSDGSVWLRLNSIRDIRYELRLGIEGGRLKPTFSENGAPMVPQVTAGRRWVPFAIRSIKGPDLNPREKAVCCCRRYFHENPPPRRVSRGRAVLPRFAPPAAAARGRRARLPRQAALPPGMLRADTLRGRVEALQKRMPCPVVFPAGFADLVGAVDHPVTRKEIDMKEMVAPTSERTSPGGNTTYRDFLDESGCLLGLDWHYDAARGAVVTEFQWYRTDPRSTAELYDYVSRNDPKTDFGNPWIVRRWGPNTLSASDPWRYSLDALLSKPENYPSDWKVRYLEDARSGFFSTLAGQIVWTGTLNDPQGRPRFVAVKYHFALGIPGSQAVVAAYAFNPDGHFLSGALGADRYRPYKPYAFVSTDRRTLYLYGYGRTESFAQISLTPAGLVLRSTQTFAKDWP